MTTNLVEQAVEKSTKGLFKAIIPSAWKTLKVLYAFQKFCRSGEGQKQANDYIKDRIALIAAIGTIGGVFVAYNAQLKAADIQGQAAVKAADIQGQAAVKAAAIQGQSTAKGTETQAIASLKNYVDEIKSVLTNETANGTEFAIAQRTKTLLKANSFTALRNLESKDKGSFVRFLAESGLIKANRPEISISGADLRNVDLHDAWLPDVNLQGAYILSGKLTHINLTRANLSGTVLAGTDFTDATLNGADFTGADLTGAHLDTVAIAKAIQSGAKFCHATMPDGKPSTQPCP